MGFMGSIYNMFNIRNNIIVYFKKKFWFSFFYYFYYNLDRRNYNNNEFFFIRRKIIFITMYMFIRLLHFYLCYFCLVRVILKFLPGIGKLIIVCISFYWSTKGIFILYFFYFLASVSFISQNIEERKKILAVYPVMLYFLYLNYYVLV